MNNRVLVTGAAGSIGSALVSHLLDKDFLVCCFDNSEEGLFKLKRNLTIDQICRARFFLGDIRDLDRLNRAFNSVSTVFHCAAYKHVEICEFNPFEAVRTNVLGTQNVIEAALCQNVRSVVLASSDKAVNPSSTMGTTKMLAEKLITSASLWRGDSPTIFTSVRFGNVWNSSGSVSTIWKKQITAKQDITVTDVNMTRFIITLNNAVELCIYASNYAISGSIIIKSMGSIRLGDLASQLCQAFPSIKMQNIGLLAGEKLYEELLSEDESLRLSVVDGYYVIHPVISKEELNACRQTTLRSDSATCISGELLKQLSDDIVSQTRN